MIERDGGSAAAIAADLNDISALDPLIGDAVARWGGLDFLVHNAGGAAPAPFEATTAEALNAAFHFNVAAPFELTKAAAGHLRERPGAAIVMITSMMGHIAGRGLITYGTVKAAADHMMRQLAVELAPRIRVNAVAPGIIATDGLTAAVPPDVRDRIAAGTCCGASAANRTSPRPSGGCCQRTQVSSPARSSRLTAELTGHLSRSDTRRHPARPSRRFVAHSPAHRHRRHRRSFAPGTYRWPPEAAARAQSPIPRTGPRAHPQMIQICMPQLMIAKQSETAAIGGSGAWRHT